MRTKRFSEVLDAIATDYAIGAVRDKQRFAHDRGSTLSAEQLVESFNKAYEYMYNRIQNTTTTTVEGFDVSEPRLNE